MELPEPHFLLNQGPCLVVLKPAGLLTQAPPGIDSLEARIKAWVRQQTGKTTGNVYLGIPHRLDRPVSGAMVFARHVRAARRLSEQFEGRLVRKIYWACVEGILPEPTGTWSDMLRKIPDQPRAEVVPTGHPEGRPAVLHYKVLGQAEWGSWLEIELETGRTHQIRVQAASRGFPILGDTFYGANKTFGPQHEDTRLRAIALHARSLSFRHPMTHETIFVEAPLSSDWDTLNLSGLSTNST